MQHRIHVTGENGKYSAKLSGRIIVAESDSVILDAAKFILESGADERDEIAVTGPFSFSPATIHAILRPRFKPRKSDVELQQKFGR